MENEKLSLKLSEYVFYLQNEERSENTIAKYVRDLRALFAFRGSEDLTETMVLEWKEKLIREYAPASVNSMLAAVNSFLDWCSLPQYKVKPLKIQRSLFAKPEQELTRAEYHRLVEAAEREDNRRLSLLLQTICGTGIRVSELRFVTVAALQTGRATVDCKGKTRTVFLP